MARTRHARRERRRLRRVLPCLARNFVVIPLSVPDDQFQWRQAPRLREALRAAGAFEVAYGRFSEVILHPALNDEIQAGRLPEDARQLAAYIEEITVFCRPCIKDIRCVVKRIEDGIPNCQPLQVDQLFIDYNSFTKDILYLAMPSFECSSPRHLRHVKMDAADTSDLDEATKTEQPSAAFTGLDEEIRRHYMLDPRLTGLSETSFQDLQCAVYRLFVNKDFLFQQSLKGDLNDSSPFLGGLLKLLGGFTRVLGAHLSQLEDGVEAAVLQNLLSFQEKVDSLLAGLIDLDGSFRLFISNIGIDWTSILEFIVLSSVELQTSLQNILSELIHAERAGLPQDTKLLKDSIEILKLSSLYESIVEVPYMRSTVEHYNTLSKRLIHTLDIGEYLKEVEMCMDRETQLVRQFMDAKVEFEICSLIVKEMITDHLWRLVLATDSCLIQLIAGGHYDDINRMFRLVLMIPDGSALFYKALTCYIRTTLGDLIADKEKEPIMYIQLILDERQKFEKIIKQSGHRDMSVASKFALALREISGESLYLPQSLSLFIDHILSQETIDLHVVGGALDRAIVLVADLDDKSVFQIYYQRHLADRLLCGTYSEEVELEVLLKLKLYCCPHYLDKLRTMIYDIRSSERLMKKFDDSNILAHDAISICVRVLRSQFWPKQPLTECNLPDEIMHSWEVFYDFYLNQHSGRKMTWSVSLGNTIVTARFGDDKEYELVLPLHHMCILVLFNSSNSLTFEEIQQKTCIPRAHLKKCLAALTGVGQNLLRKEIAGQITRTDRFFVNDQFSSKLNKLTFVNVVNLRDVHVVIDEGGTTAIDAVIVKILKGKSLGLPFNSVVKGLSVVLKTKFSITPRAVQKRLNALIEWELVRKEVRDGRVTYKYYMY